MRFGKYALVGMVCMAAPSCVHRASPPEIGCKLLDARLRFSEDHREILMELRLELSANRRSVTLHPYADRAFQVRSATGTVVVVPRISLRPAPAGAPQYEAVKLTGNPSVVSVALTDYNAVLPSNVRLDRGVHVQLEVRYASEGHYSNFVIVDGVLP